MAKEILDIYIEQGYPYEFELDFNATDNSDLESIYNCYFYNSNIGTKTFSIGASANGSDMFILTLSGLDTNKLINNLEEYVVYVSEIATNTESKLLTGRIHLDNKVKV